MNRKEPKTDKPVAATLSGLSSRVQSLTTWSSPDKDRRWGWLIGTGIALLPINNMWITKLFTTRDGVTQLFLPQLGLIIWMIATGWFLVDNWRRVEEHKDSKLLLWALVVIVVAVGISGIATPSFAPAVVGMMLLATLLTLRVLPREAIVAPLAIGSVLASVGVIAYSIVTPGKVWGGYLYEQNYDAVIGSIVLGAVLYTGRWRIPLLVLSLVAIFLTGSPEGVFAVGVVGAVVLIRWDFGMGLVKVLVPVTLVTALWFGLGYGQQLYSYTGKAMTDTVSSANPESTEGRAPIGYRIEQIDKALTHITPFGTGYTIDKFRTGIVHNVPLILVQQLGYAGILAAVAWLGVSLWCLVKTREKYLWAAILAMSVFDHFTWTQFAPYWWIAVGVSVYQPVISDRLNADKKDGKDG